MQPTWLACWFTNCSTGKDATVWKLLETTVTWCYTALQTEKAFQKQLGVNIGYASPDGMAYTDTSHLLAKFLTARPIRRVCQQQQQLLSLTAHCHRGHERMQILHRVLLPLQIQEGVQEDPWKVRTEVLEECGSWLQDPQGGHGG